MKFDKLWIKKKRGKWVLVFKNDAGFYHTAAWHLRENYGWCTERWSFYKRLRMWEVGRVCQICLVAAFINFLFPKTVLRWVKK